MSPTHESLRDILRTPYQLGGREVGAGIDCLGTVLAIADRIGLPAIDPWANIASAWQAGTLDTASGFPDGWFRIAATSTLEDGDVLLFFEHHPWAAIVCAGYVWTASENAGRVVCVSLARWTQQPAEVWRYGRDRVSAAGLAW